MDKVLQFLGMIKRAGYLEAGEEQVESTARAHKARLILTASDASANSAKKAVEFAVLGNAVSMKVPYTKEQLGAAIGKQSSAVIAITHLGMAAQLVNKISEDFPDIYGEIQTQLNFKYQRARARKRATDLERREGRMPKRRKGRSKDI